MNLGKSSKLKIFNDPIYGFIDIPSPLIFRLIGEASFQRLRRISQMGLSYLVYPGAHHTRFHHALGSMHLMRQAIQVLRHKQVDISGEEEEGLLVAILLHDIGHGPFSHAMEHSLVKGISHEYISLKIIQELNREYDGQLQTGIEIFQGSHPRDFLNQLVASQLDMDRLDYLKRDSFYTGVAEGNINSERLITMLNVIDGELVVEEKGIYSVEKFLMARRFMYWQVYLHKTSLVAEQLLINTLKRARELNSTDVKLPGSQALLFFLDRRITREEIDRNVLSQFVKLDDVDILSALKQWQDHDDFVLSTLCRMILHRKLLHIKIKSVPPEPGKMKTKRDKLMAKYGLTAAEAAYFVFDGTIENRAYNQKQQAIHILRKNGKLTDVAKASDHLNLQTLADTVTKYYQCYPKKGVIPDADHSGAPGKDDNHKVKGAGGIHFKATS